MRAGVAVIGSGIMGAWALLEASRRAHPVTGPAILLDEGPSGDRDLSGVGLASEAFVAPKFMGLARHGINAAASFEVQTGRAISFGRPGAVLLHGSGLEQLAKDLGDARIEHVELLRGETVARHFRGLALDGDQQALWIRDAAHLDIGAYRRELLELAKTKGAVTRFSTKVEGIRMVNGKVVGLETSRGFCEVERVIVTEPGQVELDCGALFELQSSLVQHKTFASALVAEEAGVSDGGDSLGGLFSDEAKLESYFAPSEAPIYAHPGLVDCDRGFAAFCDPARGQVVLVGLSGRIAPLSHGALGPGALAALLERLPFHGESLHAVGDVEQNEVSAATGAAPMVGPVPGSEGLFVALGVGERAVELAPSLAEGLVQMALEEPLVAFGKDLFAPLK